MDHETAFVKAFLDKGKWARYLQLLPLRNRRKEVLVRLNRKPDYLPEYAAQVPPDQDHPAALEAQLRALGAPATCHVMAVGHPLDGREVPLREALEAVCLHGYGSLLSCVPGRLAFHRPEAPGAGVILTKAP